MGYPMAKNLRQGLDASKTLLVCDVSKEALDRFQAETVGKGPVEVVKNGFEAAKAAVSSSRRRRRHVQQGYGISMIDSCS